jgi:hypothetical protein
MSSDSAPAPAAPRPLPPSLTPAQAAAIDDIMEFHCACRRGLLRALTVGE